jgi:hypothetical protein
LNVIQLNAQLQRLPTNWLIQMGKQYGVTLTSNDVELIKRHMQHLASNGATINDVKQTLFQLLDEQTAKKLFELLQLYA